MSEAAETDRAAPRAAAAGLARLARGALVNGPGQPARRGSARSYNPTTSFCFASTAHRHHRLSVIGRSALASRLILRPAAPRPSRASSARAATAAAEKEVKDGFSSYGAGLIVMWTGPVPAEPFWSKVLQAQSTCRAKFPEKVPSIAPAEVTEPLMS
jgi:hypothetical protein